MNVLVNPPLKNIDWSRMSSLFRQVGWGKRPPHEVRDAFAKSSVVCLVYQNDQIIGFGRTVDDGRYYAMLVDVIVDPAHQRQGVGKTVVQTLREHLKGYQFINLSATAENAAFYEKLGWQQQGSAYFWPKNEKQRIDYGS